MRLEEVDEKEVLLLVGLWTPGLVFCCFAGGRRETLLLEEDEVGFRRDAVEEEEELDLEDLVEGLLTFTDGLTAIAKCAELLRWSKGMR